MSHAGGAEGLLCPFEFGLGLLHDGFGGVERRLRLGPARFGMDPLLDQLECAFRLVACVLAQGNGLDQLRLRRCDRGGRRSDRLPNGFELRLGAADRQHVLVGLDAEQNLAGLDALIGVDADFDHPAAHLGGDLHQVRLHKGLRRVGRDAVGGDAVGEEDDTDRHHDQRQAAHRVCRRLRLGGRRGARGFRCCLLFRHGVVLCSPLPVAGGPYDADCPVYTIG